MDTLFASVDIYCERTGPELWAEPLNAISNVAFVLVGIWGLRTIRHGRRDGHAEGLAFLVFVIGIGSGTFHTFANRLTVFMDTVPIALFIFGFTIFVLRRFFGAGITMTALAFVGFYAVAGLLVFALPDWVNAATNGSIGYAPALLAMLVFGGVLAVRGHPAGFYILSAAAVFVVSLTFRAIDMRVCANIAIGTHFLWHVLNAMVLGILLAAAIRYGEPKTSS